MVYIKLIDIRGKKGVQEVEYLRYDLLDVSKHNKSINGTQFYFGYYENEEGFKTVFRLIDQACNRLTNKLQNL